MSDDTKRQGDEAAELEQLPEREISAEDAEGVKGGIIVIDGRQTSLSSPTTSSTSAVPMDQISLNYSKIEF